MKSALTLGVAITLPEFLCLLLGIEETAAAFAALFVGIVLATICGLLTKKSFRVGSPTSVT